jgi:hypothetical protein
MNSGERRVGDRGTNCKGIKESKEGAENESFPLNFNDSFPLILIKCCVICA